MSKKARADEGCVVTEIELIRNKHIEAEHFILAVGPKHCVYYNGHSGRMMVRKWHAKAATELEACPPIEEGQMPIMSVDKRYITRVDESGWVHVWRVDGSLVHKVLCCFPQDDKVVVYKVKSAAVTPMSAVLVLYPEKGQTLVAVTVDFKTFHNVPNKLDITCVTASTEREYWFATTSGFAVLRLAVPFPGTWAIIPCVSFNNKLAEIEGLEEDPRSVGYSADISSYIYHLGVWHGQFVGEKPIEDVAIVDTIRNQEQRVLADPPHYAYTSDGNTYAVSEKRMMVMYTRSRHVWTQEIDKTFIACTGIDGAFLGITEDMELIYGDGRGVAKEPMMPIVIPHPRYPPGAILTMLPDRKLIVNLYQPAAEVFEIE